jgi:hypothetical protein
MGSNGFIKHEHMEFDLWRFVWRVILEHDILHTQHWDWESIGVVNSIFSSFFCLVYLDEKERPSDSSHQFYRV